MHLNRITLQDAAPPGPAAGKHQPVKKNFEVRPDGIYLLHKTG